MALSNLLLVPLFLHYWSPSRYGEWLTISSLAAYLGSADFGMTSAAINELTQRYCRKDFAGFVRLLHTALSAYICIACLFTVLGFVIITRLPFERIGVHGGYREVGVAASLLVAQVVWYFPWSLVFNFYRTVGDFHKSQWLSNLYQFLLVAVTLLGFATGAGFAQLAALQLGVLFGMTVLVAALINMRYRSVALGFRNTSFKEIGPLLRTGSPFALMTIGNTISLQGPIMVISLTLGPIYVAAFSTVRTVANAVRQSVGVFTAAAWPELTIAQASKNEEVARGIHRSLVIATTSVSIAAGVSLWFVGPQIISLWTHAHLPDITLLVRWFALRVVLQAPWVASSCVSESGNNNKLLSVLFSGSALASVVLSALTIRRFGVGVVPVSIIVAEGFFCAHFVIKNSCTLIGESYKAFAFQLWTRILLLIAVASGVAALISSFPSRSVIHQSIALSAGTTFAVGATAWFCWLKRPQRAGIRVALLRFMS